MSTYETFTHPGGLLDFQDSGRGFYKGRIQIQRGGCVKTPAGAMSTYSLLIIALYLAAKFINFPGKI